MGRLVIAVKSGVTQEQVKHAISCVGDVNIINQDNKNVLVEHPDNRRDYIHALKATGLFKVVEQEMFYETCEDD